MPLNLHSLQTYQHALVDATRRVGRLLGLIPSTSLLPRRHCHYLTLPLRGVPAKHAEAAIRLHLQQLGLFSQTGFAFRLDNNLACVWYWDDAAARQLFTGNHVLPCPEPLLREPVQAPLRLSQCIDGYELEGQIGDHTYKSRWFATLPNQEDQAIFCRDLGLSDAPDITPTEPQPHKNQAARGWVIYSSLAPRPSPLLLAMLGILLVSGALGAWLGSRIVKTDAAIQQTSLALQQLKQQRSQITALEAQIGELSPLHKELLDQANHPQQIELLAALAASNILGGKSGAWLTAWSYQQDGVTLTIKLGDNSRRSDILARLEAAARVSELMLMPDPPAGSMVVRLRLNEAKTANNL